VILNRSETHVVSSRFVADDGALWWCETASRKVRRFQLSAADHLTLYGGSGDEFAAVHHFRSARVEISAHAIESPREAISRVVVSEGGEAISFEGDRNVWRSLPRAYVAYSGLSGQTWEELDGYLFLVDGDSGTVQCQRLDWFSRDRYDFAYQTLLSVTEVPGRDALIFAVQRSRNLVLYDPGARQVIGEIGVSRSGNPTVRFRMNPLELWADSYDTLNCVDPTDWSLRRTIRLMPDDCPRSFTGPFAFDAAQSYCAVARPRREDVLILDVSSLHVVRAVTVLGDPYDVALLTDGTVLARSLSAGNLLDSQ